MPRIRSRRRAGILAAASAALTLAAIASPAALASVAFAADPTMTAGEAHTATLGIDAPAGASVAWIEFEQAGLPPAALEVSARLGDGVWREIDLTGTTFGLHGELPVTPGRLEVSVQSAPGNPTSTPDAALTVLDASGDVLASSSERLNVPGLGMPGGSDDPAAVTVVPSGDKPTTTGTRGNLAATGAPDPFTPVGLALAAILAGAGAFALRALTGRRHDRRTALDAKAGA